MADPGDEICQQCAACCGEPGLASDFLAKIVAYIEAREAEIDRLSGTTQQICDVPPETSNSAGSVVPLYRSPTLTDAERVAVEWAASEADEYDEDELQAHERAAVLRGLLARHSAT